jgi:hypothetical protein
MPIIFQIQKGLGGSLDSPISTTYALLFDKPQDLLGSEFGLVDAVADTDSPVGASGDEESGVVREPLFDEGESLLVSKAVLGHGLFPAVDPGEDRVGLDS